MKKLLPILFLFPAMLSAQRNFPLNREWALDVEKLMNKDSVFFYPGTNESVTFLEPRSRGITCFKPIIVRQNQIDKNNPQRKATSVWKRKIKQENLFIVNDTADKFYLTVDPILNFEFGKDLADKSGEKLYKNTRGFLLRGDIGKKDFI